MDFVPSGRSPVRVLISEFSQNDEVRELREASRASAELGDRCLRLLTELVSQAPRGRQTDGADVGRLALLRVLAGGLAERRRARVAVEHIVDHLESEAHRL